MRKKFNNKGLGFSALLILGAVGVAAYTLGSLLVDDINETLYGLLRSLLIWIDTQVYSIAAFAYSIFYELSSSSLLSSLNLASASQRLYTLLGIFMLFRLAFSFVKYIINPEGMEKGTSKLISNLAISLALIVSVPWIFNRAFALQSYIMESNVIGNLIMGMNTTNKNDDNDSFNAASYGQSIGFLTFSAFFRPNTAIESLTPCSNLLTYYTKYVVPSGDKEVTVDPGGKSSTDAIIIESNKIAQCVNALNGNDNSLGSVKGVGDVEIGTMFYIASQRQNIGLLSSSHIIRAIVGNSYVINYTAIVSTIAGGFLALLFLSFSFDVAIRNVKLCFLQIIAPIPIILNIEPGDTKSDKKPLNWWIKESLKTYTDLFIRVATVYFGVFLINELFGSGDTVAGSTNTSVWFQVFMILGILLFVKQIPDLIGKAFGIDVKGQFNLNPLKRIGDSRLASMAVGGAAGLVTGLGTGAAAFRSARLNGANMNEALGRAFTGGVGGTLRSGISGAKKGVKSMRDITGNANENLARSGRIAGSNVGTTVAGRMSARMAMRAGAPTQSDIIDRQVKAMEDYGNSFGNMKSFAVGSKEDIGIQRFTSGGMRVTSSKGLDHLIPILNQQRKAAKERGDNTEVNRINEMIEKYSSKEFRDDLDAGRVGVKYGDTSGTGFSNVKDANDYVERLKASGASVSEIKAAEDMTSAFVNNYIDSFKNDKDHAIGAMWAESEREYKENAGIMRENNIDFATDAASLKSQITASKSAAASLKLSDKAKRAARAKAAAQAGKGK